MRFVQPCKFIIKVLCAADHPTVRATMRLCVASSALCSGALALIMAIMVGFDDATRRTLQGGAPDLVIEAPYTQKLAVEPLITFLQTTYPTTFAEMIPHDTMTVLLQHPRHTDDISHITTLHIVPDPTSFIRHFAATPSTVTLPESAQRHNTIILGTELWKSLMLNIDDHVIVRYPIARRTHHTGFQLESIELAAIAAPSSLTDEWNHHGAAISSATAQELIPTHARPTQLALFLHPSHQHEISSVASRLSAETKLHIRRWEEQDPAYLAALQLEQTGMGVILFLLLLLTGITTSALVALQIVHQEHTLALMLAMGLSPQKLIWYTGSVVTILNSCACVIGLLAALSISYLIDTYHLISLPNAYYVSYLPARMSLKILCICFALSSVVTIIATILPLRSLRNISVYRLLAGRS